MCRDDCQAKLPTSYADDLHTVTEACSTFSPISSPQGVAKSIWVGYTETLNLVWGSICIVLPYTLLQHIHSHRFCGLSAGCRSVAAPLAALMLDAFTTCNTGRCGPARMTSPEAHKSLTCPINLSAMEPKSGS